MTEPGPWTRDDLDEWRCPECGRMSYTPKSLSVLMLKCPDDHGMGELEDGTKYRRLVWMERLYPVTTPTEETA